MNHCWTCAWVCQLVNPFTMQHVCRLVMGIYSEDNKLLESKISPPIKVISKNVSGSQEHIKLTKVLGAQLPLESPQSTGDEASSSLDPNLGNQLFSHLAPSDAEDRQHACRMTMGTHTEDDMLLESSRSFPMEGNSGNVSFRSLLGAELPLESPQSTGDEASSHLNPNLGNYLFTDLAAGDADDQHMWPYSKLQKSVTSDSAEFESLLSGRSHPLSWTLTL